MFGTIPTAGGATISIFGSHLGLVSSSISGVLTGGSPQLASYPRSFAITSCTVGSPRGSRVDCVSPVGVGGPFRLQLFVDGGSSNASDAEVWFTNPTINTVEGEGKLAPTEGQKTIVFRGSNFGVVGASAAIFAWARPTDSMYALVFPATDCAVIEDHVAASCTTASSIGATLSWTISIEDLNSTVPVSGCLPPSIVSATLSDPVASTTGTTWIDIEGRNFGAFIEFVKVWIEIGASGGDVLYGGIVSPRLNKLTLQCSDCSMVVAHRGVRCLVPRGGGVITAVTLDVLGQST